MNRDTESLRSAGYRERVYTKLLIATRWSAAMKPALIPRAFAEALELWRYDTRRDVLLEIDAGVFIQEHKVMFEGSESKARLEALGYDDGGCNFDSPNPLDRIADALRSQSSLPPMILSRREVHEPVRSMTREEDGSLTIETATARFTKCVPTRVRLEVDGKEIAGESFATVVEHPMRIESLELPPDFELPPFGGEPGLVDWHTATGAEVPHVAVYRHEGGDEKRLADVYIHDGDVKAAEDLAIRICALLNEPAR